MFKYSPIGFINYFVTGQVAIVERGSIEDRLEHSACLLLDVVVLKMFKLVPPTQALIWPAGHRHKAHMEQTLVIQHIHPFTDLVGSYDTVVYL